MKQQALAGDIVLLFADESEALTHPYLARAWAKRGADLRVPAPGQSQKIAMMGALDFVSRQLTVVTSQTKRSADFIAMLERLDQIHGPSLPRFGRLFRFARGRIAPCPLAKPGMACKPVIRMELDGSSVSATVPGAWIDTCSPSPHETRRMSWPATRAVPAVMTICSGSQRTPRAARR